jgi:ABC-type Fe3+/spermidine/putrescine transport system ATPase subunit
VNDDQGRLVIDDVSHVFGRVEALRDVALTVEPGAFVTLLGPSGCGKTTLLRIVAGFLQPTAGRILLGSRDVTRLPPHRRPVNTVFQRPTLFPHLDVGENVAFGLRVAGVPQGEIVRRVGEALALVRLEGYERRRSHELSGGQMQRVALARVLVGRPRVLLLDEPLSALDLAIRLEMEVELRRVHRETGATFVYVTHDQREALALSDRIVVFNQGRVEQSGTPEEIYRAPASPFAARFVGDANVIAVEVAGASGGRTDLIIGDARLPGPSGASIASGPAWLVLRPEAIRLTPCTDADEGLRGRIQDCAFRGAGHAYRIAISGTADTLKAEIPAGTQGHLPLGSAVTVQWDAAAGRLLRREAAGR